MCIDVCFDDLRFCGTSCPCAFALIWCCNVRWLQFESENFLDGILMRVERLALHLPLASKNMKHVSLFGVFLKCFILDSSFLQMVWLVVQQLFSFWVLDSLMCSPQTIWYVLLCSSKWKMIKYCPHLDMSKKIFFFIYKEQSIQL